MPTTRGGGRRAEAGPVVEAKATARKRRFDEAGQDSSGPSKVARRGDCNGGEDYDEEVEVLERSTAAWAQSATLSTARCAKKAPKHLPADAVAQYHGQSFSDMIATGHARVHYGNVYNTYGSSAGAGTVTTTSVQICRNGNDAKECVRIFVLTGLILRILEEFLLYILGLLLQLNAVSQQIPKQLLDNCAVFEDAFGRISRIDIDIIPDWKAFDSLLVRKFQGVRGLQRVINGKYRLHDDGALTTINPLRAGSFLALFKPGSHVRMSIYFGYEEVVAGSCPRCGTEQSSKIGQQTVCVVCKFMYVTELPETVESSEQTVAFGASAVAIRPSAEDMDKPEHFNRISIGQSVPQSMAAESETVAEPDLTTESDIVGPNEQEIPIHIDGATSEFYAAANSHVSRQNGPQATAAAAAIAAGQGNNSDNYALQDYEMQLMLLEQLNKKRLLMARQEQDSMAHPRAQPDSYFPSSMFMQGIERDGSIPPNPGDTRTGMMDPSQIPGNMGAQMTGNGLMMRPPASLPAGSAPFSGIGNRRFRPRTG